MHGHFYPKILVLGMGGFPAAVAFLAWCVLVDLLAATKCEAVMTTARATVPVRRTPCPNFAYKALQNKDIYLVVYIVALYANHRAGYKTRGCVTF